MCSLRSQHVSTQCEPRRRINDGANGHCTDAAPLPATEHETEELPTIDSLSAQRRQKSPSLKPSDAPNTSIASPPAASGALGEAGAAVGSPGELEEEADQQGAFNPETGEINWDCPCLGGMAHGPCGEEFKAAFSCFVYSKEEPKGMDCIDRFKWVELGIS